MNAETSADSTSLPTTSSSEDRGVSSGGTAFVAGARGFTWRHFVKAPHARGIPVLAVVRDHKRLADYFAEFGSLRKAS